MDVYLRIAPETYLKRAIVGGFTKVFEFARCFRNEGMDTTHLQDFTMLEGYCAKYKFSEVQQLDRPEIVKPLLAEQAAIQKARSALLGHAINAHEINQDHIVFEKVYLYLRPVFAFEFVWSSADKVGVIEVNGLTGEVNEDGRWFKEKLDKILTRDMLIEASSELAGAFVPGGGLAVKLIGRVTE